MDLIINLIFAALYLLIAARIILPFIPHHRESNGVKWIYQLTDPVLIPLREGLPPEKFGYDVSPFMVILLLFVAHRLLLYFLGGL